MNKKFNFIGRNKTGKLRTFSFFLLPSSFSEKARRAFSLVEMLVVIGILSVLIGIGINAFSGATRRAQQARTRAVVHDVATALESILNKEGSFPRRILAAGGSDGEMTEENAYELAKRKVMSLAYDKDSDTKKTLGLDRCGVVTPWAQDVLKRNNSAGSGTAVPSGGTIKDHTIHFAVDTDGDGFVNASVGGESVKIRASAVAWCCGRDGVMYKYSEGVRHDCAYSWSRGQVER